MSSCRLRRMTLEALTSRHQILFQLVDEIVTKCGHGHASDTSGVELCYCRKTPVNQASFMF